MIGMLHGPDPFPRNAPPEPELLARIARRAERRAKLGLPTVVCAGEPPTRYGCSCLDQALDEPGEGGKRHVLTRAGALHWNPPPRSQPVRPAEELKPVPQEAFAEPQQATESVEDPSPQPEPTPTPEPPPRIVRHFKRWYDDDRSFRDMTF
jgi:hypothetical protein